MDVDYTYSGDHLTTYTSIESSDCIAKTDNSVCQLHLSLKKKERKKERKWCLGLAPGESDLTDPWSIQILGLLKTSRFHYAAKLESSLMTEFMHCVEDPFLLKEDSSKLQSI